MKAEREVVSAQSKSGEMQSCSALKMAYNDCFNRWYTDKFLKGQWDKEECQVEWEAYRACLSERLTIREVSWLPNMDVHFRQKQGTVVCKEKTFFQFYLSSIELGTHRTRFLGRSVTGREGYKLKSKQYVYINVGVSSFVQ